MSEVLATSQLDQVIEGKLEKLYPIGRDVPPVPEHLPEPNLSENAWYIGRTRYARRDAAGNPTESARDMFWRVAYNIATAERLYKDDPKQHLNAAERFYTLMSSQSFLPNTPTLLNAGKPGQQLSACFVLPVEDSLEAILKTASDMARIHRSGGGTGFSFSHLRPKDDVLSTSGGRSTGPVSFMQMYNDITSSVRQGGVRRGANMGMMHYTHPDILLFAVYKVDEFSLTNFNISVSVTEEFFRRVEQDAKHLPQDYEDGLDFEGLLDDIREAHQTRDIDLKLTRLDAAVKILRAWCDESNPDRGYELINPKTKETVGRLNAKKIFDIITRLAWHYGDPGMIIIDRINESRANPVPNLGQIEATNPCGEQPLFPYDACTLGSINLAKFIKNNGIDWESLGETVHQSVRFLDDVLDMNEYPIPEVRQVTRYLRRIGLGIMGLADSLFALRIGYNTPEGLELAEQIMQFIQNEADKASDTLGSERGTFPAFTGSIYDKPGEIKPRNGARTTIAPTGTIAMLADTSSGCEPLFALTFAKNTIEGKRIFQTSPYFLEALKERGIYSEVLLEKIQQNGGSIQSLEEIPDDLKEIFVVAGDITPEWHLKMQAALQRYTDNAISKTINFRNEATVEDVRKAYLMSYETGCKGITIYRDGSRQKQVLEVKKESSYYDQLAGVKHKVSSPADEEPVELRPRPEVLHGSTYKVATPVGTAFVSINEDSSGNIFEVFINVGRAGSDITADAEAIGRLISLTMRIPSAYSPAAIAHNVTQQLAGIGGSSATGFGAKRVRSLADGVAKVIREHLEAQGGHIATTADRPAMDMPTVQAPADFCPDCGVASLRFIEGCQKCENCGFSKC